MVKSCVSFAIGRRLRYGETVNVRRSKVRMIGTIVR